MFQLFKLAAQQVGRLVNQANDEVGRDLRWPGFDEGAVGFVGLVGQVGLVGRVIRFFTGPTGLTGPKTIRPPPKPLTNTASLQFLSKSNLAAGATCGEA